jgi:adenylyltransferase/sulfurtransferase
MKKWFFFVLTCTLFVWGQKEVQAQYELPENAEIIDPLAFLSKKINLKHHLLDLRTEEEYAHAHIEGARCVTFVPATFKKDVERFPLHTPLMIYCENGETSEKASFILEKAGFRTVIILEGGIESWNNNKLKTVQLTPYER